jgi:hypothetical protein
MSRMGRNLLGVALAASLAGCVAEDGVVGYSVGVGYGTPGFSFGYGYSDYGYGYDPYSYGTYYGSLMFGNAWHYGPHRYRWGRYGREYFWRDRWRRADRDDNGQWQDDPPSQGDNANREPPPRPNAGFWRERNAAAARARAEQTDRTGDRPAFVRGGGNEGGGAAPRANVERAEAGNSTVNRPNAVRESRGNPWIRGDGGGAAARAARPGPGQAAARARAGDDAE